MRDTIVASAGEMGYFPSSDVSCGNVPTVKGRPADGYVVFDSNGVALQNVRGRLLSDKICPVAPIIKGLCFAFQYFRSPPTGVSRGSTQSGSWLTLATVASAD